MEEVLYEITPMLQFTRLTLSAQDPEYSTCWKASARTAWRDMPERFGP
ncbi:hypothetical protein PSAN_51490 [Pseudomonas antarctica]|uniref:Transposase n=1 Tax=Pseudomonas antarctica TaxID=219572 RepID=A0ABQ6ZNF1_9PSED|nr:hypothetical protein PSAN_51490 [Pseudomonas antarctica]